MGLVDPSILQQRGNPLAEGIQSGMGIGQAFQQGQDRRRTEAAKAAFQAAAQGKDITTPEGMGAAIKGMVDAGFADEGRKVYEAHKDLFAPKTSGGKELWGSFTDKESGKNYLYHKGTGQVKEAVAPDATPNPDYIPPKTPYPTAAAAPWKGERFVRSKDNTMVKVDANGKDQNGNLVEIYQPPAKGAAKPPAPNGRDIPSLRTQSKDDAKAYTNGRNMLNAAEADYANYLQDPTAPTSRVHQQGIIDKYTNVSLNKSPTEAQLELAQAFPGIESWLDLKKGKLLTGQIVPKGAIDEMMRDMRGTVINFGTTLKQSNARQSDAARRGQIDPNRVINVPDDQITADSTRYANAPGMERAVKSIMKPGEKKVFDGGITIKRSK